MTPGATVRILPSESPIWQTVRIEPWEESYRGNTGTVREVRPAQGYEPVSGESRGGRAMVAVQVRGSGGVGEGSFAGGMIYLPGECMEVIGEKTFD
jgi:hypothetical protein